MYALIVNVVYYVVLKQYKLMPVKNIHIMNCIEKYFDYKWGWNNLIVHCGIP